MPIDNQPSKIINQKSCYPLHGIVPIINTPFDERLKLDFPSLGRLLEQSIADGIVGCIVPAVASEVDKLSDLERRRLVERVVAIADGRIQVVAGASSENLDEAVELARHGVKAGADGILCRVPDRLEGDREGIVGFFTRLSQAGMEMLMIQDLSWGGYGASLEVILEMFEKIPAFRCIKIETIPAGLKSTRVLEATQGRLNVSSGWSLPEMIEALDRGIHGFNTTAINKPFVHIYRLHREGRRAEAMALFDRILPYLAFVHQHIDISIHFLKRYCVRRGLFSTHNVREPILPYDAYHERCGSELIERVVAIEDGLGSMKNSKGD